MFKKFFKKLTGDICVDDMFAQEKIPATKAYMVSKYGQSLSKEDLLKDFFNSARNLIQLKTSRQQFSVILELNEDIKEYLPQIVEHYRQYGYNVIVIDDKTNINNEYNEKFSRITMTLVILTWDNPKVETDEKEK